jgi:hypothetical protein
VVIDDTDREVQYTGEGWFQDNGGMDGVGNFGPTYKRTQHGTIASGSVSYTFQGEQILSNILISKISTSISGSSVAAFGTTNVTRMPTGAFNPSWECFVDQNSLQTSEASQIENNALLCAQLKLADGLHELTIKTTVTAGGTFWLDSIRYTPSPGLSLEAATLLVPNSDPDLHYDSNWHDTAGTASFTQTPDSTVTFSFIGMFILLSLSGFLTQ